MSPRTAEERLRAAALGLRDHIAGPFVGTVHSLTDDCWDEFYAALAVEPVPAPLDVRDAPVLEAAPIEMERLARAMLNAIPRGYTGAYVRPDADAIAREYARLATPPEPEP